MNKILITGRITKDIELKGTDNKFIANTIAVYDGKDKNEQDITYFFDFKAFNYNANKLSKYATKGSKIAIEGNLRQDKWQDENGNHSKVVVYVDSIEIMSGSIEENTPQNVKKQVENTAKKMSMDDDNLPY